MSYAHPPNPRNLSIIPITVGASPFIWQNSFPFPVTVIIAGGTLSGVFYSRDGTTYMPVGAGITIVDMEAGDYIQITYLLIPTSLIAVPRS